MRLGEVERGRRRKKGRGFLLILDRELRGLEMVVVVGGCCKAICCSTRVSLALGVLKARWPKVGSHQSGLTAPPLHFSALLVQRDSPSEKNMAGRRRKLLQREGSAALLP